MKALLCLPLLLAGCVMAEELADRAAIDRVIALLNETPRPAGLFTKNSDAAAELERLPTMAARQFPVLKPDTVSDANHPRVIISHRPWGEATIALPGITYPSPEIVNPRFESGAIRFVTPKIALADGVWTYKTAAETIPLLFVMKKEGESWKIASVRLLAPR